MGTRGLSTPGGDGWEAPADVRGVEAMLAALGNADRASAPAGLESRVAAATTPRARSLRMPAWAVWAGPIAAAAMVAIAVVPASRHFGRGRAGPATAILTLADLEAEFSALASEEPVVSWDIAGGGSLTDEVESLREAISDPWGSVESLGDAVWGGASEGAM